MRWKDVKDIALALEESHADEEIERVNLNQLHNWVVHLLDFDDDQGGYNQNILEMIVVEWKSLRDEE